MAEDKGREQGFADDELVGDEEDQDFLFKTQMGAANFFLGYWKHLVGVLGIGLLAALFYGLWEGHVRDQQRVVHAAVSKIERKLPAPQQGYPMLPMDDLSDPERVASLSAVAVDLEKAGEAGDGPGRAWAYIRAAQTWQRAGKPEMALKAWSSAHAVGATGTLGWAAAGGYAGALVNGGEIDTAVGIYRTYADAQSGAFAEQALYGLGNAYLDGGRTQESVQAYEEFLQRFPDSSLVIEVASSLESSRSAG